MKPNIYTILVIFCVCITNSIVAQNDYYYYKGKKIDLSVDNNLSSKSGKLSLKSKNSTRSVGISNIFYVKLKKSDDVNLLQEIASQKNVNIVKQNEFMSLWYRLELQNENNKTSLDICNEFYETGYFADIDPAFQFDFDYKSSDSNNFLEFSNNEASLIINNTCSTDTNFSDLWGLNNTTNPNVDINICDAWTITEGLSINVAVLDKGIYKYHNDLNDNVSTLLSYDVDTGGPAEFQTGVDHGTHVAGIIAAEKNNGFVVGVAPQAKLISISANRNLDIVNSPSERRANGILWAVANGAHIINNSWGDQGGSYYNELHSQMLEEAIDYAIDNGVVVVFASGNYGNEPVTPIDPYGMDYPAYVHDDILVVGSIDSNGNKAYDSAYGDELDVVAPGVDILSTTADNFYSIGSKSGTSMAAPHASGIAALILSVNSNLTAREVNTIIESTAQKVGNYTYTNHSNRRNGTWNKQTGYGLVDAHAAVVMAQTYCQNDIIITDNVTSVQTDIKQAYNTIEATNIINPGANASYRAGSSVTLKPGFHAKLGVHFTAYIENCGNGATSTNKSSAKKKTTNEVVEEDNTDILNRLYPNPFNRNITLQFEKEMLDFNVKVLDMKGSLVFNKNFNKTSTVNLDLSKLESGIYLLNVYENDKLSIHKRIIKE